MIQSVGPNISPENCALVIHLRYNIDTMPTIIEGLPFFF